MEVRIAVLEDRMLKIERAIEKLTEADRALEFLVRSNEQILQALGHAPDDAAGVPGAGLRGQVAMLVRKANLENHDTSSMAKKGAIALGVASMGAALSEVYRAITGK